MMARTVLIDYMLDNRQQSVMIPVNYEITLFENIRTISCVIQQNAGHSIPGWLRPFKFDIKSMVSNGQYETLYSDYAAVQNLDAALFIDKARDSILQLESNVVEPISVARKRKA